MKRIFSLFLCLLLLCSCAIAVCAADTTAPQDATEINTGMGASNAFFIFSLIVIIAGGIYLYFMLKK